MKLYKLTESNLLVWEGNLLETNLDWAVSGQSLQIKHGVEGGNLQTETLPFPSRNEAETELKRRVHIKTSKQGYTEEIPTSVPNLPMLVSVYKPELLPSVIHLQPKLDGIRCLASNKGLRTRRNEPITSLPLITEACSRLPDGVTLDGELYHHGSDFQTHLSLIKRDSRHPSHALVSFNVFDWVETTLPYNERYEAAFQYVLDLNSKHVTIVPSAIVTKSELPTFFPNYTEYEGAVLKDPDSLYRLNHRSQSIQKYKWTCMDECKIIDIVAATSGREEGAAIFVCSLNGVTFKARPKLTLSVRRTLYKHKDSFIGRYTRVTYEGLSALGKPLKPRAEGYYLTKGELN